MALLLNHDGKDMIKEQMFFSDVVFPVIVTGGDGLRLSVYR